MVDAVECSRCHRLFDRKDDHIIFIIRGKKAEHLCTRCSTVMMGMALIAMDETPEN